MRLAARGPADHRGPAARRPTAGYDRAMDPRRAHAGAALALFSGLGFHVGLWAVLIPDVAAAAGIGTAALGASIGLVSLCGMASLLIGGPLSDRVGRRPVAVAG